MDERKRRYTRRRLTDIALDLGTTLSYPDGIGHVLILVELGEPGGGLAHSVAIDNMPEILERCAKTARNRERRKARERR